MIGAETRFIHLFIHSCHYYAGKILLATLQGVGRGYCFIELHIEDILAL